MRIETLYDPATGNLASRTYLEINGMNRSAGERAGSAVDRRERKGELAHAATWGHFVHGVPGDAGVLLVDSPFRRNSLAKHFVSGMRTTGLCFSRYFLVWS